MTLTCEIVFLVMEYFGDFTPTISSKFTTHNWHPVAMVLVDFNDKHLNDFDKLNCFLSEGILS